MLFDWERFTRAHPAIDLAPLLPGFGSAAEFDALALLYLDHAARPPHAEQLPQLIELAKIWSAVELLDAHAAGRAPGLQPGWLVDALNALLAASQL